jgi:glycosyltransferase involved in cell wall biosynthesis
MKAKISIVMPVLNGQKYIGESLQSISDQTYKDFELVLINDGSTDGTEAIIRSFMGKIDIKYVHHATPWGISRSVNDGIGRTVGDFICFLDHDDAWFPDFLETQLQYLLQHPDVGMVHSDFQTIDSEGKIIEDSVARSRDRSRPSGEVFRELFWDSFVVANSVLIRRECFDRLGGFDETLLWGDYHMWLRIARHYRMDYVPRVLTKYRQHASQSTRSTALGQPAGDPVAALAIRKLIDSDPDIRKELGQQAIDRRIADLYFGLGYNWWLKGAGDNARVSIAKAIRLYPTNVRYYLIYMASWLQYSRTTAARGLWHRLRGSLSSDGLRSQGLKKVC